MAKHAKARSWGVCKDLLQTFLPLGLVNLSAGSDQVIRCGVRKIRSPAQAFMCECEGQRVQPRAAQCSKPRCGELLAAVLNAGGGRIVCRAWPDTACVMGHRTQRHGDRKHSAEGQLEAKNTPAPVITAIYHVSSACLSPCPRLSSLCLLLIATQERGSIIIPI